MDTRPALEAFEGPMGTQAAITRPWENPISTKIIWIGPIEKESPPVGLEYAKRGARELMAVRKDEVPKLQRGSIVNAAGPPGDTVRDWQVDSIARSDRDYFYAIVVPETKA
jgi:hypothetical protein